MSFTFTAAPRVVRTKRKYRSKKEKKKVELTPWEQERNYVKQEEEKIKLKNKTRQLNNFKKQKRMRPYDIKPSPNPRIPVELEFFLTDDYYVELRKPQQKSNEAQTDELEGLGKVTTKVIRRKDKEGRDIVEYHPEQLYIPKKTGVDVYCQVENDELFDFDREVQPILDILITKTLEQSVLELEEEQEIKNMQEFKRQYVDRKAKKNDDDWKEIIEVEVDKIDKKDQIVKILDLNQMKQQNLQEKVKYHKIACDYLRDLLPVSLDRLESRGLYNNESHDSYIMDYTDYLIEETCKVLKEDFQIEEETKQLFPEVEPTLAETRKPFDFKFKKIKAEMNYPFEIASRAEREFYIYLRKKEENSPLVFSCYLTMIWDDSYEEYESKRVADYENIQQKLDVGHINQDEFEQMVKEELPNPALDYYSAKIDNPKDLHFSFANNPYKRLMKHERAFSSAVCVFNEYGEIIEKIDYNKRKGKMARYKIAEGYLHERPEKEEDVIIVDTDNMKVLGGKYALVYVYGKDFDRFAANVDELKKAQYRLFNRKTGINFFKGRFENAMDNLFLMDFGAGEDNKENDEEEEAEKRNCIVGCFLIYHDEGKGWGFDHLRAQGFGYETESEFLKIAGQRMTKMHHRANMKDLLGYWNKKLHEEQVAALNSTTLGQTEKLFGKKEKVLNSGTQSENEEEYSEKDSEYEEEENHSDRSEDEEKKHMESGLIEHSKSQLVSPKINIMPDNGNSFIGPVKFNFDDPDYEKMVECIEKYFEEKHPEIKEEYPDGFDILFKKRHIDEDVHVLKKTKDYREIQLLKLIREDEPEEEMLQGDEEQNSNVDSDE